MSMMKSVGRLFVVKTLIQVLSLVGIMYFTRQISPTELGTYFYFLSLLGACGIFADLGIGGASEKYASERGNMHKWHTTALVLTIVLTGIVFAGLSATSISVVKLLDTSLLPYFGVALLADRVRGQYTHILRAELRASLGGVLELTKTLLFLAIAITLIYLNYHPALIIAMTLSRVLVVPVGEYLSDTSLSVPSLDVAKKLFSFGIYYSINTFGNKIFMFADVILVGIFLTPVAVARYELAWKLFFGIIALNNTIGITTFSYISKKGKDAKDEIISTLRTACLLPLPAAVGAALVGPQLVQVLFTESYDLSRLLMATLGAGLVFQSLFFVFSRSLIAIDEPREAFFATLVAVTANIILNVTLIPRYGIVGAAASTTISFVVATATFYLYLRKHVDLTLPWRDIGMQATATVIMGIVIWEIQPPSGTIYTVALVILGGLVYFSCLTVSSQSREMLRSFI